MPQQYNPLTSEQIDQLIGNGCECADFSKITVVPGFNPALIKRVRFAGNVQIGAKTSLSDIHWLKDYRIDDNCEIRNVGFLGTEGQSTFGNGIQVDCINEAGGREVPIYDKLSAQIAYIIASYRDMAMLTENLKKMIFDYAESKKSSQGRIAHDVKIINTGKIKNVNIGPFALIENAGLLDNGTINSNEADSVHIGVNVIARDFIASSGSHITDAAIINKAFIGQAVAVSKQASVENSLLFANSEAFHGELLSVFAGPFTVSHHKATLLIAGMFSFFNAGSASNQSNHLYKLGPVHQAVYERGCKFASSSHVICPARIGPFTVVLGKHGTHPDTADMPFSYLVPNSQHSMIIPAVNLQSVGTLRDIKKWPNRDKRKDPDKLDNIIFDAMTPLTVGKMIKAVQTLRHLLNHVSDTSGTLKYNNCEIRTDWAHKGIGIYELAIDDYLGSHLAVRLANNLSLEASSNTGKGKWLDMAGLVAPKREIDIMLEETAGGAIGSLDQLAGRFQVFYDNFEEYEWDWISEVLAHRYGADYDPAQVIIRWKNVTEKIAHMILDDAAKEFNHTSSISYGLDGSKIALEADFEAVRGTLDTNSFVKQFKAELAEKQKLADSILT